jgi:hypothetical protein
VHGQFAAPRRSTAARAGGRSRRGHTPRLAPRDRRVVARRARLGGGGPATPRERVVTVANGRSVVILALVLGSERNQG